ncbi:UNVERIFIED_CONTAM: hypothetical protein GTU68_005042 [Idotea baltica]|nr:hypothetical protein [Idotea baltica]
MILTKQSTYKVGIISLGCPKALVDSERILTQLRLEGYQIVSSYKEADLVVVNTCGFIDSAKTESLQAIGEAIAENGKVIVTGCLGKNEELIREIHPKVLSVSGPQQYEQVLNAIHSVIPPRQDHDPLVDLVPPQGVKLTPRHYAYLKISEGCNHHCSFCIIPDLRGKLTSRPAGEVLEEAEKLARAGVKELLIIAQDLTSFWNGTPVKTRITELSEALSSLGIWIRLHYIYPYPHVDELIPLMAEGKILPYLDIPLQHASPKILKAMKRPAFEDKTLERIRSWRKICPEIIIRSTFIVGFPGETEEDFQYLLDWLTQAQLDRVGCFQYSEVDGAKSNELENLVPDVVKEERWNRFMVHQQAISATKLQKKIGQQLEVLVDSVDEEGAIARSIADAPEIDGNVFINDTQLQPGDRLSVQITKADEYDLWGECI